MAMPGRYDARDGGHVFTSIGSGSQPTRTTRTWTQDGVHYTVDTTSWSSPGLSFGAMTGSANGSLGRSFTTPVRPAVRSGGGGLFGSAFGLLEDMLSLQQQRHAVAQGNMGQTPNGRRRVHVEVESDTDDDLAYEYDDRSRSKGVFSRLKDRLLDGKHKTRTRDHTSSREQSPARRPRPDRRHSSYRTETREPSLSQQRGRPVDRFVEVDYDEDDEDEEMDYSPQRPKRDSHMQMDMIEALENAVEIERRQVRDCKRHLEQATRQPAISSHYLQRLLDDLKKHETALLNAQTNLDEMKAKQRSSRPRPTSYHQSRVPQPQQPASTRTMDDNMFGSFGIESDPFFGRPQPRSQHSDPLFQAFQDMHSFDPFGRGPFGAFDQLFEQMHPAANDAHFRFFTNTGAQSNPNNNQQRKRTRFSTPNGGTQFPNTSAGFSFPPPPPPPQPPANLLKPDEAKRLFKTYNDRWTALPATDANIPYPARGLKASSLSARDSLYAPLCAAHPSTWSEETIMQANAQAFYLGVVGLSPIYKEAPGTGRIEIGFDKTQATPAQIKDLVDVLKKEKMRWHSDRLGRRNGGGGGGVMNEVLQKDERARAVFHAVCELMENAQ
ncbi:hypothetical protein M409DRAFT_15998 [Zasmidium cellare ATCC 36951]|uniref:Uncharacterized protein n=1 Tax=Zasmidium cellare ATCC 36951 TaxID=1080233 RepID=A0A6A6D2V0_ZASCE|nr:uncharacterized protein M409DRAFT_15998 [Zasmidium cellare ATCC 36951]KAF2173724.1 hypothetical protein M409DRAFT_15998 [Zasmidium cellare ATCC 36951]